MILSELLLEAILVVDTLNEEFDLQNETVKLNVLYSKLEGVQIALVFYNYSLIKETSIIWKEQDDQRHPICLEDGSYEPLIQYMRRNISSYLHYNYKVRE